MHAYYLQGTVYMYVVFGAQRVERNQRSMNCVAFLVVLVNGDFESVKLVEHTTSIAAAVVAVAVAIVVASASAATATYYCWCCVAVITI